MRSNHERSDISPAPIARRDFLARTVDGVYGAALAWLIGREMGGRSAHAETTDATRALDLTPKPPHVEPRAKAVIQLFMDGGPSQIDLFDPKPMLEKHHGKAYLDKVASFVTNLEKAGGLMKSPFKFAQHGESGLWVSELLPHIAAQADELCVVRSMYTTHSNHEPALYKIHTGQIFPGRPAVGSWITYGLGSECEDLPAFVVLEDPQNPPVNGPQNWQSGFLPPIYQGTRFRSTGAPVLNLKPDVELPAEVERLSRRLIKRLDEMHLRDHPGQTQLDARIASYALAARMQMSATDALDFSSETKETLEAYGIGEKETDSFGRRCLMARRMVERGVRFVQIFTGGGAWDSHFDLPKFHGMACKATDKPIAGLLRDLKQRGLLDSTLVIWGGEFGRTPTAESGNGRDHGMNGFTSWMAGGGVKSGFVCGATDDFGFEAVENPVSVADWHATILRLLGLDYEQLYFERNGFKERLTGVEKCRVVEELFA